MKTNYDSLRAEVLALPRRTHSEPYPTELRERLTVAADELRAAGATWERVGTTLAISGDTAKTWLRRVEPSHALVPVRVIATPTARLALVSPGGFRVEGLGVDDLIHLLRQLG